MATQQDQDDPQLQTRWSLVTRLKDWNDQEGWRDFFDTYWRLIYGVSLKAGLTDSEAQEVVQETVISVAKGIERFKADPAAGSFKGWLMQIVRWRITDQFRKRSPAVFRHRLQSSEDTARTDTLGRIADPKGIELEAIWDQEYEQNLMDRALEIVRQKANQKHYQIFHLMVIKGMSTAAVCETLGVTPSLAYVAKFKVSRLVANTFAQLKKSAE